MVIFIRTNTKKSVLFIYIVIISNHLCYAKTVYNVSSKNKVQIGSIQGYSMQNIAIKFSQEFNRTSNEELGVSVVEKLYQKFKYTLAMQDINEVVKRISVKLETKLYEIFSALNRTREIIEAFYKQKGTLPLQSTLTPCNNNIYNVEKYEILVNTAFDPEDKYMDQFLNLTQVFNEQKEILKELKGGIKQQYFLSSGDIFNYTDALISKCNGQDQSLLWKRFMSRIKTVQRNIMLLVDHGGSLSKKQVRIVKAVAKQMISVLSEKDNVGIIALSDYWSTPYLSEQCLMPNQVPPAGDSYTMSPATQHNKNLLYTFIESLTKGSGATNHTLGFEQAFQTIRLSNVSSNDTVMLLYISRGLLSSLTEAKTVLETISYLLSYIDNPIVINTCAVIDESKPIIYETHFLRDIAEQAYSKYNVASFEDVEKGLMLAVNSTQAVGLAVARYYNIFKSADVFDLEPRISLPTWDVFSKDLTISFTIPCSKRGYIGLLGMDIYFSNIAEDVTYYTNYEHFTYAFIINTKGMAVMHPSYPRPVSVKKQLNFVDISHLEKSIHFKPLRELLLTKLDGQYLLRDGNQSLKYVWKRIMNWYVVCVVINQDFIPPVRPKVNWFPTSVDVDLVHHRLDILPAPNLCRHLNQIATLDAGTFYLSASCFQSPFTYIHTPKGDTMINSVNVQSYMAFLKDNTGLLSNPGLREEVRDDVGALAHILEFLRTQHLMGPRAKYIVRRYVTSPSGVLQVFPGSLISQDLEPTKRQWYLRAVEHRFRTILTPPYLDVGGAGYIVTVAYATSHVVVAMDVTFGYIYKLILERMPFCSEKNVKCFMMDDRGYLVYHPNLIDPNGPGPIEQRHIIHKESLVANDILNHKHFVKKRLCNNYADGTIQRYYSLNTSLNEVLINAVHGEHCVKYQVSAIRGTNVFIGAVNATCEVVATFCPCSMVDRLCLNCNRMEQKECECPCECPLNLDTCTHPNNSFVDNPLCSSPPEQSWSYTSGTIVGSDLKNCIPVLCEVQVTYESCLGVLGCEWCQLDVDGESLLASPFCTSLATCFNGVLGSVTPYGDSFRGSSATEDLLAFSHPPAGPVIGLVIGICLVFALLFLCYRTYNSPSIEHFYLTSAQDNQVRMSDLNISDDFHEIDNHQDKLLQEGKRAEPISPYCVATGYRRPVTAADSDHGYSTMTPHDESENLSFAPVEIDSLEDDCISDATSGNISFSSKANRFEQKCRVKLIPQQNELLTTQTNKHCVIAPVTVHRNMEPAQ